MGSQDRLKDGLTYRDLAGRRRVRRYVLAATAIFSLIIVIVFWGWWQRGQLLAPGVGGRTGQPAIAAGQWAEGRHTPTGTQIARVGAQTAATAEPASTAVPLFYALTPDACPADPKAWELLQIAKNDNFKRIDPPCVYDGLARTVAWDLLRVTGYSAPEAAEALGFTDLPWHPLPEIIGMTNTQGPKPIALANPSDEEVKRSRHPDAHAWIVNRDGKPAATFTLRGCYRTETIQGDRVKSWGVKYPVVCIVAMDQGEWAVMELGSHRYVTRSLPARRFFMYGYAGEGVWVSLGYQREPFVEIRLPGSGDPAVLLLTMELEQIVQDWKFTTGLHGLLPWDAAWLEGAFGLSMRTLPENWQSLNDPAEYQAIQDEKEAWVKERLP